MELTEHLRYIIHSAKTIAYARDYKYVEPEHLMLALFMDENDLPKLLLERIGLNNPRLIRDFNDCIPRRNGTPTKYGDVPLSSVTTKIIEDAEKEGLALGDDIVGIEYILMALFKSGNPTMRSVFRAYSITMGDLYEKMKEIVPGTSDGAVEKHLPVYEVKDGKWQPWGMEMLLSLRRRLNPVDLIVSGDSFYVPSTNSWIGFDMAKKDWVYEGKTGVKSDFEVFVTWDGKVTAYSDMLKVDVRFTGRDEGYYLADPISDCSFSGIYSANTNNVFRQEFSCRVVRDGRRMLSGIEPGKLIVMRSRCEHDNGHRLVGANYSVLNGFLLHGGFNGKVEMTMCYFFNPTPNDTNLEPKR